MQCLEKLCMEVSCKNSLKIINPSLSFFTGHITDDWDRRLCITYLEEYMQPDLVDGELFLAPNFPAPPNTDYIGYHNYIDENIPPESPYLYVCNFSN